jgi:hypothetical protein
MKHPFHRLNIKKESEMKLTLDREDLKPQFQEMPCRHTSFENFKEEVQEAILAVGRATFYEYDGRNYNAIHPSQY